MLELENVINNSKKKLGSLRGKLIGDNNQGRDNSNIINDLDEIISELTASLDSKIEDQDITEQKKAELKLKESEEKFRLLFESIADPIHVIDADLKIIYINPAFERWLKSFDLDLNIVGRTPVEAWPFIGERVNDEYQEIFKTKQIHIKEDWAHFNDIHTFTETRKIPILKSGNVFQVITIIRDFSERKKAEQKLKESEEKFRTIAEQSFMGIIILQDGLFKYFNQRAADINGYSVEEIQNWKPHEFAKLIHPEDRDFVMEQARKKQGGEIDVINRYSYRVIKKSGEVAWFDNYSKTINFEGRSADLIMTEDITDKIIAEQQLKESEEFFRTITEQSLLGIIIIQDRFIKYVNDIALNYSGYSRDEVINLPETQILKFIHTEDRDIINQTLNDPNPNMVFRIITKEGKTKWIDIHTKTIYYKGKEAYLSAFLDVTEKKEAENLIKDEITKLKELDELKNEFVYRASHELKTPLNSIVSASSLLIDSYQDFFDERVYGLINVINKGGKRLDELIGDLLDVSRIDSGKLTIKKKKEDIVEIIKSCTQEMIFLINKRNLNIEFKYLDKKIYMEIDKKRFEQVILNILSNSIKNTPSEGSISFNIKSEKKFIDLSITDTGVGFTKKEKEKLFQKFGKIERHGKGMDIIPEGTGLGLYISKEIVELHGGEIWVESQGRNKGSTIVIRLPYKK